MKYRLALLVALLATLVAPSAQAANVIGDGGCVTWYSYIEWRWITTC